MNANSGKRAGGAEEYGHLRSEMTQIQSNVRTLWGSLLVIFIAVVSGLGVLVSNLPRNGTNIGQFIEWGGLNFASGVLLAIVFVGAYLAYTWLLHTYYLGSYLIAFHENEGEDKFLKFLTRHRGAKSNILKKVRDNYPKALGWTVLILILIASVPLLLGLVWVALNEKLRMVLLISPFSISLVLAFTLLGLSIWRTYKLFAIHNEQQSITEGWQHEKSQIQPQEKPNAK